MDRRWKFMAPSSIHLMRWFLALFLVILALLLIAATGGKATFAADGNTAGPGGHLAVPADGTVKDAEHEKIYAGADLLSVGVSRTDILLAPGEQTTLTLTGKPAGVTDIGDGCGLCAGLFGDTFCGPGGEGCVDRWGYCTCNLTSPASNPVRLRMEETGGLTSGTPDPDVATATLSPNGTLSILGVGKGETSIAVEAGFTNQRMLEKGTTDTAWEPWMADRWSLPARIRIRVDEETPAVVAGNYRIHTGHSGPITTDANGQKDDQSVVLQIPFNRGISLNHKEKLVRGLSCFLGGTAEGQRLTMTEADVSLLPDGRTLQLVMHISSAAYSGHLQVQPGDISGALTTGTAGGPDVVFPAISGVYVPNGVALRVGPGSGGDGFGRGTTTGRASVTKTVFTDSATTRGMVHLLFTSNGNPVGVRNSYGGNLIAHYHDYLTLNGESFGKIIADAFNANGAFAGYRAVSQGGKLLIGADTAKDGELLDISVLAWQTENDGPTEGNTKASALSVGAPLVVGGSDQNSGDGPDGAGLVSGSI